MTATELQQELSDLANPEDAVFLQRFFKTGRGEYGEGDVFRGIRMPVLRETAKKHRGLPFPENIKLLHSAYHEDRMLALILLTLAHAKGDAAVKEEAFRLYLANTRWINNWDLVDCSSHCIVGAHLLKRDRSILYELAVSENLWERRISIVSTWHFIRKGELKDTFDIARLLLSDRHDLMHKAVGWMLREAGKKNQEAEEEFLREHYRQMPRTMLRYAIEKFPEGLRQEYLKGMV